MPKQANSLTEIDSSKVYPLPIFMQAVGMSKWAIRQARRAGLRTVKVGNRSYVRGSDWDEFLANKAEQKAASTN